MRLTEKIRSNSFWIKDFLTGSQVRRHLKEIRSSLTSSDIVSLKTQNENKIRELIKHTISNCNFYFRFKGAELISDFPVINKTLIKENQDSFIARNIRRKDMISITTSGSTGTPFKTFHDIKKKARNYADTLFFAEMAGYELGHRLVYLKIWVKQKMRSRQQYWLQNIVPVDVIHFNEREIGRLLKILESDKSTFSVIGYASVLEEICKYLDKRNYGQVRSNIRSMIAISETLNEYTRASILRYFRVPVVSRYSNLENGIIAQQKIHDNSHRYLINTASYYVEILKIDSDTPAEDGELGRIVVTDLYNYALPMIRYDTGDIGAMDCDPLNSERKYLKTVEGRKLDLLYDTAGNLISSFLVYKNMWQYTEINQYQLIQESDREYTFRINATVQFKKEEKLIAEFKEFLGKDASLRVEYVSEIPLLSSGKRKKIVSRLKKVN